MTPAGKACLKDQRGSSSVEFALVAVPFLLLLFGTIEYGRLLWTRQAMESVAISAARCMAVPQSDCATSGVYNATKTRTFIISRGNALGLPLIADNITLAPTANCNGVSGFSTAALSFTFETSAPFLIETLAGGTTLSATACFPHQS